MMPTLRWCFGVAMLVAVASAPPAWARAVKMETAVPLSDHSDQSVERALKSAVDTCMQGATAMGLSSIWLHDAAVLTDRVVVQMIATDDDVDDEDDARVLDLKPRGAPTDTGAQGVTSSTERSSL